MSHDDEATRTTALITGANSGVGFETAYRLASAGAATVTLACRTLEKAEAARRRLRERGAPDVFETLAVGVSEVASASKAAEALLARHSKLDLLIWNAGVAGGSTVVRSSHRVDVTFASTLVGHHALTMRLLKGGGIASRGRIRVPKGIGVFAVSPGNTPATNMGRDLPWPVRKVVFPLLARLGPLVGMAHSGVIRQVLCLAAKEADGGAGGAAQPLAG
jgi:NAD(P)-dependent dehydrogenase (short-subunit alcohol dehydrogenase family)